MARHVSAKGGPDPFFYFGFPLAIAYVGSWAFCFLGLLFLLTRQGWFIGACFLAVSLAYIAVPLLMPNIPMRYPGVPSFLPKKEVRMEAFHELGERLRTVIDAIETYENDHGYYPQRIQFLVPEYLEELPRTGMANYPSYEYLVGKEARYYEDNPYVIRMDVGYGMGFDKFFYFPEQNYPEQGFDGRLQRLGRWAYLHE